jgi:uncharacterized protein
MTRQRILLASIHDVSPRFESEIDALIDTLQPHVGSRIAMLVVPNHWGDAPIDPRSAFAARIRKWSDEGFETFLHGFYHRDDGRHERLFGRLRAHVMTAGEGEFLGLSRSEAAARISSGRKLLEDITGRSIAGFVAPAWLYSEGTLQALADAEIPVAENHLRVWSPVTGAELARGPVITWASRTTLRLLSSLAVASALRRAPIPALRVGVHPSDVRHRSLLRSIGKTLKLAASGRSAASYARLLRAA